MSNPSEPFRRPQAAELARRLAEPRRFLQVMAGPRQVGKTTLVQHCHALNIEGSSYRAQLGEGPEMTISAPGAGLTRPGPTGPCAPSTRTLTPTEGCVRLDVS